MPVWGVVLIAIAVGAIVALVVSRKPAVSSRRKIVPVEPSGEEDLRSKIKNEEEQIRILKGAAPSGPDIAELAKELRLSALRLKLVQKQVERSEATLEAINKRDEIRKKVADAETEKAQKEEEVKAKI